MPEIQVSKFHSYGNDFILAGAAGVSQSSYSAFARDVCQAHFGLGADGCLFVRVEEGDRFRIWQFNRDGSEFGMSGNGVRCAAAFLRHRKLTKASRLVFETLSGIKQYELLEEKTGGSWTFRSLMGCPDFDPGRISTLSPGHPPGKTTLSPSGTSAHPVELLDDYPLEVGTRIVRINGVWVGNPQCVLLVDSLPGEEEFLELGSNLENHPFFPKRTNVSFVRREGNNRIRVRIWERGVGPTCSSGTGSCGAAVTAIRKGMVEPPVEVATETGVQIVQWTPGEEIVLSGTSEWIADAAFNWRRSRALKDFPER